LKQRQIKQYRAIRIRENASDIIRLNAEQGMQFPPGLFCGQE